MKRNIIARLKIFSPQNKKYKEIEIPVDTGSTYTWIPENILKELGIKVFGKRNFETITGDIVTRNVGLALVSCNGSIGGITVVFAKEKDKSVLGLVGLEDLGLDIDTKNKKLVKVDVFSAF